MIFTQFHPLAVNLSMPEIPFLKYEGTINMIWVYIYTSCVSLFYTNLWFEQKFSSHIVAFAELQTDMSDLITEINTTGIPYWDYKNFTFKILFPGETDHPTLHKLMVVSQPGLISIVVTSSRVQSVMKKFPSAISHCKWRQFIIINIFKLKECYWKFYTLNLLILIFLENSGQYW